MTEYVNTETFEPTAPARALNLSLPPGTCIYVSGPMEGFPNYNYEAFHATAEALRNAGDDAIKKNDDATVFHIYPDNTVGPRYPEVLR